MSIKPEGVTLYPVTSRMISIAAYYLARRIGRHGVPCRLWGVPRGGVCAAYAILAYAPTYLHQAFSITHDIDEADIIVDDLVDSGATRQKYKGYNKSYAVLFDKWVGMRDWMTGTQLPPETGWLVFPWEVNDEQ